MHYIQDSNNALHKRFQWCTIYKIPIMHLIQNHTKCFVYRIPILLQYKIPTIHRIPLMNSDIGTENLLWSHQWDTECSSAGGMPLDIRRMNIRLKYMLWRFPSDERSRKEKNHAAALEERNTERQPIRRSSLKEITEHEGVVKMEMDTRKVQDDLILKMTRARVNLTLHERMKKGNESDGNGTLLIHDGNGTHLINDGNSTYLINEGNGTHLANDGNGTYLTSMHWAMAHIWQAISVAHIWKAMAMAHIWQAKSMAHIWQAWHWAMAHIWQAISVAHIWEAMAMAHIWQAMAMAHIWQAMAMAHI